MITTFTKYISSNPINITYDSRDLLSYASYVSNEIFKEKNYKEIIKDFINCRKEFKNMVEAYLDGNKININRFIELGELLNIVFYYEDPQELVVVNKKYSKEELVIWVLNYYKDYLYDIKHEGNISPSFTGEIGTVGYYGGYIEDVNRLDDELKALYFNSLNELERKSLGL